MLSRITIETSDRSLIDIITKWSREGKYFGVLGKKFVVENIEVNIRRCGAETIIVMQEIVEAHHVGIDWARADNSHAVIADAMSIDSVKLSLRNMFDQQWPDPYAQWGRGGGKLENKKQLSEPEPTFPITDEEIDAELAADPEPDQESLSRKGNL